MSATVEKPWTDDQLRGEEVGKKELITFLQSNASERFLVEHKLKGSMKNVAKTSKRDALVHAYTELFDKQAFSGGEGDPVEDLAVKVQSISTQSKQETKKTVKPKEDEEIPKFKKTNILKKGDKVNYPQVGDKVKCYYVGKLSDGTVFDSLLPGTKKKKNQPLQFKVGKGNVIKGWDRALLTMTVGEKCEIIIEPEWAYGKAGKPEAKIPSNAELHFEIELLSID